MARVEIPLSEVLPAPAGGEDTGKSPPVPPFGIGHHIKFPWSKEIKAIAIMPAFEVPTAKAREVLPTHYPRQDVTFNLQRIALLPVALGQSPPDPDMIYLAMQDKLHQQYRQTLIPGLGDIIASMSPSTQPGLLGVCLSGAGPTILALATSKLALATFPAASKHRDWAHMNREKKIMRRVLIIEFLGNFEEIADRIIARFKQENIECKWKVLEPAEGAKVIQG